VPLPTPLPGTASVVAVTVTVPSRSVAFESVASPLASVVAVPRVEGPTENVITLPATGVPPPVTCTVSGPCQPVVPAVVSLMQVAPVLPLAHSSSAAVGVVNTTTGAMPTVTLQGAGVVAMVVLFPAGSVATADTVVCPWPNDTLANVATPPA